MAIKHKYVSKIKDEVKAGRVKPSNWNDNHDLEQFTAVELNKVLPIQSGETGKYLQTNGSNATWQAITADLPSFVISDDLDLVFTDSGGFVLYDV